MSRFGTKAEAQEQLDWLEGMVVKYGKFFDQKSELVDYIQATALVNYEAGGWDVIVECYGEEEIREVLGKAKTFKGALAKFAPIVSIYADREADAINSAF